MTLPRILLLISLLYTITLSTVTAATWNTSPMAQVPVHSKDSSPTNTLDSSNLQIDSIVNKFMVHLDKHIKNQLRKVMHHHVSSMPPKVRGATAPAQQKEMELEMADKLGDFLAQDFRPHVYKAFITLERQSRDAKVTDKQMKKLARSTFKELERDWREYARKKIEQWERDQSYLLSDVNANSQSPQTSTETVTSLSKRTLYKRSIWNAMLKTIIAYNFIEVLFAIFATLAGLIGLGVNHYRKHHRHHSPYYGPAFGYPY